MRSWIALTILLASPALASAQLRFTQPAADLGELRGGPVYQHRFEFVNDAAQPIEITDTRLGCGCLQPMLDKRVYQAGEKGSLLMHVRTLGQAAGARTWQAHVQYRLAGKVSETSLVVGATIRNEVTVEPSIVALTVETILKQELTIKDHRVLPMKISAITASSPAIKVTTYPTDRGMTKVFLEVSRADLTAARQEATLDIYSDDPNYRHLQVPITLWQARRPDVSATPDKVELTGGGSQLVRLRASGDKAVRVDRVETSQPGIKCTWASGPGNDAMLKISVNAALLPTAGGSVRILLAEPSAMTLSIPVLLR